MVGSGLAAASRKGLIPILLIDGGSAAGMERLDD